MPGFADWLLPAIGATVIVVVVAAVAALRGTAPSRPRPSENRGFDLREHAGGLAGPVAEAFTSLAAMDVLAGRHPEHRPAVLALLGEHLRECSDRGDDAVTQAVQRCLTRYRPAIPDPRTRGGFAAAPRPRRCPSRPIRTPPTSTARALE